MKSKYIFGIILIMFIFVFLPHDIYACTTCKITAEEGIKAGNTTLLGINKGILYLAAFPYTAVCVIAFFWWRGYKKRKREEAELLN